MLDLFHKGSTKLAVGMQLLGYLPYVNTFFFLDNLIVGGGEFELGHLHQRHQKMLVEQQVSLECNS